MLASSVIIVADSPDPLLTERSVQLVVASRGGYPDVVATVNSSEVRGDSLSFALALDEFYGRGDGGAGRLSLVLGQLIENELLVQEAQKRGLWPDNAQIKEAAARSVASLKTLSEEELAGTRELYLAQGVDPDNLASDARFLEAQARGLAIGNLRRDLWDQDSGAVPLPSGQDPRLAALVLTLWEDATIEVLIPDVDLSLHLKALKEEAAAQAVAPSTPGASDGGSGGEGLLSAGSLATLAVDANAMSSPANTATTLGSRQACSTLSLVPLGGGTSTGNNGPNTLNDTTRNFAPDILRNFALKVTSGAGAGQVRLITGNSATQVTVSPTWTVVPDATSAYSIRRTLMVDVTVDSIPGFDPGSETGGLSSFGFNLHFDPGKVAILGVNPGGDSDTLLAASGQRTPFDVIDGDASIGPEADSLPAVTGNLRVDMGDLSTSNVESGSGVLARLVLVGVASGVSYLELSDVLITDSPAQAAAYAIDSVLNGQVAVATGCP